MLSFYPLQAQSQIISSYLHLVLFFQVGLVFVASSTATLVTFIFVLAADVVAAAVGTVAVVGLAAVIIVFVLVVAVVAFASVAVTIVVVAGVDFSAVVVVAIAASAVHALVLAELVAVLVFASFAVRPYYSPNIAGPCHQEKPWLPSQHWTKTTLHLLCFSEAWRRTLQ